MGKREAPLWFQLYLQPERDDSLSLIRRAEAAGYGAIVLTVDAAIKRTELELPAGVEAVNLRGMAEPRHHTAPGSNILFGTSLVDTAPRWEDVDWLRAVTKLPILLKGLVHGADLDRALLARVDGIILSNHGGRVFDGFPSALDMLPSAVRQVGGRVPILVDGGIRSGTDIATAAALGADATLVGRPILHGLAVAGMPGIAHILHILRTEFELALAQLGCACVEDVRERAVPGR